MLHEGGRKVIILIGTLQAKPGREKELENRLKSVFPKVKQEQDTVEYVLHRAEEDNRKFLFYEKYRNREAMDYHMNTAYLQELFKDMEGLMSEKPQIELFEDIADIAQI